MRLRRLLIHLRLHATFFSPALVRLATPNYINTLHSLLFQKFYQSYQLLLTCPTLQHPILIPLDSPLYPILLQNPRLILNHSPQYSPYLRNSPVSLDCTLTIRNLARIAQHVCTQCWLIQEWRQDGGLGVASVFFAPFLAPFRPFTIVLHPDWLISDHFTGVVIETREFTYPRRKLGLRVYYLSAGLMSPQPTIRDELQIWVSP